MELYLERFEQSVDGNATIGHLSIGGVYECFTLEDRVREVPGQAVGIWKIPHVTAIPSGDWCKSMGLADYYTVQMVWSPHFQCMVPLLYTVPGYTAVEIHWGNKSADTDGCLLVGQQHPSHKDWIANSVLAWTALMPKLEKTMGIERQEVNKDGRPMSYHLVGTAEPVTLKIGYHQDFFSLGFAATV